MLILDNELALSKYRTLLCKLCRELRPLKDIEYCVRCARKAVAKAVTKPMEFMLILTLMEMYQRLTYVQQCTSTCCRNLAGQLILKSNEILKSPLLREWGIKTTKESQSNHSKSHKGENHTYTPKQIEKMRKSRDLMSTKVRNWGFVIAASSSKEKDVTGSSGKKNIIGPRTKPNKSGIKSGGHDRGTVVESVITRKTNLVA